MGGGEDGSPVPRQYRSAPAWPAPVPALAAYRAVALLWITSRRVGLAAGLRSTGAARSTLVLLLSRRGALAVAFAGWPAAPNGLAEGVAAVGIGCLGCPGAATADAVAAAAAAGLGGSDGVAVPLGEAAGAGGGAVRVTFGGGRMGRSGGSPKSPLMYRVSLVMLQWWQSRGAHIKYHQASAHTESGGCTYPFMPSFHG